MVAALLLSPNPEARVEPLEQGKNYLLDCTEVFPPSLALLRRRTLRFRA